MKLTATCRGCGEIFETANMVRVESASRHHQFICRTCVDRRGTNWETYHEENNVRARKQAGHGLTWSIELEAGQRNPQDHVLYDYKFIPTHDGTVAVEWKSPIWTNLSGQKQMFKTLCEFIVIDRRCGTHCNVGIAGLNVDWLRRYYHSLFIPLCEYLQAHTADTEKVFGRGFNTWAEPINQYSNAMTHENFINLQHDTHVEFRMAKLVTPHQYTNLMKMTGEMVKCLQTNFVEYAKDYSTNSAEDKAKRAQKAKVTAQKLVKIFQKFEQTA
jgi:hypothetical protein